LVRGNKGAATNYPTGTGPLSLNSAATSPALAVRMVAKSDRSAVVFGRINGSQSRYVEFFTDSK